MANRFTKLFSRKKASSTPVVKSMTLGDYGIDSDSTLNRIMKAQRVTAEIVGAERPSNMWFRTNGQTQFWYQYALMDWYRSEVSVLSTVIHRSATELFRYGLELTPKFVKVCSQCGYECQTNIDTCPECGSRKLRKPNHGQLKYFRRPNGKSFLDEANDNGQSLKDVLRAYAESQYQNNQAYTICVTGDHIDPETGELLRSYPLEFVSIDPKFVRFLYDDTGKPGNKYAFIMEDRNTLITLGKGKDELDTDNFLDPEGRVLYPAAWQIGTNYGGTGKYWLYTLDEVYQDHWMRQTLLYGMPIWFDIEDDLLTYHYIEKHNLKKYKFGYVRKIVILPGFNDEDVEDITKGIQDVLATNDNSCPIVCTPPQMQGVAEQRAQTLELGTESSADLMQIKDDIRDRICAHCGVPNLFVGDVEQSGGMNNESQQITAYDRYLMDKYDYLDRQCKWIMSFFPMITDFELTVTRPSKAASKQRLAQDELQYATGMMQNGFIPRYVDGHFIYPEISINQIQFEQQMQQMQQEQQQAQMMAAQQQMQQMQGMMAQQGGGPINAGQPELQDLGSARREDGEIADSKEAVDLSAQEAMGAFAASASMARRDYSYRKDLSPQSWRYFLAKDATPALKLDSDKVLMDTLESLGDEVSEYFKTCTKEQAKEIYKMLIKTMQDDDWSLTQIKKRIMNIVGDNDGFTEKDAERIANTEVERILCVAKERYYEDEKVVWVGPLDDRTTAMCKYAQTGKLSEKYEHLRKDLPEWKRDGFTVKQMKTFLHKVWQVFHDAGVVRTKMISDWSMHIGCRHTFQPIPPTGSGDGHLQDWEGDDEGDVHHHSVSGCLFEVNGVRYVPTKIGDAPQIFVFKNIPVAELIKWAKTCSMMAHDGAKVSVMAEMLRNETAMGPDEAQYLAENAKRIDSVFDEVY